MQLKLNARRVLMAGSLAVLGCLMSSSAYAQYRTSIQGSVTDPDGSVVPGAKLTLIDKATNATQVRTSGDDGVYNFNALPADNFKLTVEKPGFQTKVLDNLQLIPEQPNSVTVKLALGAIDQTVTVDASSEPALDTATSNIGTTITNNDIQHMPSSNRDVFTLTQLAPGTVSDGSRARAAASTPLLEIRVLAAPEMAAIRQPKMALSRTPMAASTKPMASRSTASAQSALSGAARPSLHPIKTRSPTCALSPTIMMPKTDASVVLSRK